MKIEVINYDSDEGLISLDIDQEAKNWLLERGFNAVLRDAMDKWVQENNMEELVKQAQADGDYDIVPEEVKEKNRKHMEYIQQYEEWKKDESPTD